MAAPPIAWAGTLLERANGKKPLGASGCAYVARIGPLPKKNWRRRSFVAVAFRLVFSHLFLAPKAKITVSMVFTRQHIDEIVKT